MAPIAQHRGTVAQLTINAEWFASLSRYMDKLQQDTSEAASNAVSFLHDRVVERARMTASKAKSCGIDGKKRRGRKFIHSMHQLMEN